MEINSEVKIFINNGTENNHENKSLTNSSKLHIINNNEIIMLIHDIRNIINIYE